jgi:hypothetical protein
LAFDVVEVDGPVFILTVWLKLEFVGLVVDGAVEKFDDFEERSEAVDFEFGDDGGFGGVGFGEDEAFESLLVGHDGDVDGAIDAADIAVEAKFAYDESFLEGLAGNLPGDGEDGDGDGEIEAGAFFADVAGSEVADE